jgi:hypothetical protein
LQPPTATWPGCCVDASQAPPDPPLPPPRHVTPLVGPPCAGGLPDRPGAALWPCAWRGPLAANRSLRFRSVAQFGPKPRTPTPRPRAPRHALGRQHHPHMVLNLHRVGPLGAHKTAGAFVRGHSSQCQNCSFCQWESGPTPLPKFPEITFAGTFCPSSFRLRQSGNYIVCYRPDLVLENWVGLVGYPRRGYPALPSCTGRATCPINSCSSRPSVLAL